MKQKAVIKIVIDMIMTLSKKTIWQLWGFVFLLHTICQGFAYKDTYGIAAERAENMKNIMYDV